MLRPTVLLQRVANVMVTLNGVTESYPEAVPMFAGRPEPSVLPPLPTEEMTAAFASSRSDRWIARQYGPTAGRVNPLVAESIWQDEGIDVAPAELVMTNGAQEALFLALSVLCDRDDALLLPDPVYVGASGAAGLNEIPVLALGSLERSAIDDAVVRARRHGLRARALYVVPDHDNPTGRSLTEAQRNDLVAAAEVHDLTILEDSPYRAFRYEGSRLPSLTGRSPRVWSVGTFSKTVCPGLRLGYLHCPSPLRQAVVQRKALLSVNTSALSQSVLGGLLLRNGSVGAVIQPARDLYKRRRDAVVAALRLHMPDVDIAVPEGGFFIHVPMPLQPDEIQSLAESGLLGCPVSLFSLEQEHPGIRLAFSAVAEDRAAEGIAALARYRSSRC